FDSSATPKVGQTIAAPRVLARVDLARIRERLTASQSDSTPTDDPKSVKDLKRALAEQRRLLDEQEQTIRRLRERGPEMIEVPAVTDAEAQVLLGAVDDLRGLAMRIIDAADGVRTALVRVQAGPIVEPPPRPSASPDARPARNPASRA